MPFDNTQPAMPDPKIENDPLLLGLQRVHALLSKGYMKYSARDGRGNFCAVGAVNAAAEEARFSAARYVLTETMIRYLAAHAVRPTNYVLDPSCRTYNYTPEQLKSYIEQWWSQPERHHERVVWCNNQTDKATTLKMVSDAIATRRNELLGLVAA